MVEALMSIGLLSGKLSGVFTRPALISSFLLINAFVWYSYAIILLQDIMETLRLDFLPNMLVWSVHFTALIVSALTGVYLTKRLGGRIRFLAIWIVIGTISSFAPFVVNTTETWGAVTLGLVFGVSLGFGMPNCMGYFNTQTPMANRGRLGGIIMLLSGVLTVGLDLIGINSLAELTITLIVWRAVSLVSVAFAKPTAKLESYGKAPSYRKVFSQRPFVLYFIPWIMFALLNYLTTPVQQNVLSTAMFTNLLIIENVFLAAFAFVGGIFMDLVGRKRLAITGFVMLGLSYSFLGFFDSTPIWFVHTAMNGISWGILYVLFVITIWGDMSHEAPSDKFYALGVSPFFISKMLQLTIDSHIIAAIPVSAIFSFTALFLFLAVLPLVYAPETLPEKIIQDRELKNYIEKAQKIVTKTQKKEERNKEEDEAEESEPELEIKPDELAQAEELAQKYY